LLATYNKLDLLLKRVYKVAFIVDKMEYRCG